MQGSSAEGGLRTLLISDIKQAFFKWEESDNGSVALQHLEDVMRTLYGPSIPGEVLKQFTEIIDKDALRHEKSVITFSDFLNTLMRWTQQDDALQVFCQKRKFSVTPQEQNTVNKKFKRYLHISDDYLDDTNSEPSPIAQQESSGTEEEFEINEEKSIFLRSFRSNFAQFSYVIAENIRSTNSNLVSEALQHLLNLFKIYTAFSTPIERMEVSRELIHLFAYIIDEDIVRHVINAVEIQNDEVKYMALSVLNHMVHGPQIAHTPIVHPFHEDYMLLKRLMYMHNAIPIILPLLDSSHAMELRAIALQFITEFGSKHYECRDALLKKGAQMKVVTCITDASSSPSSPLLIKGVHALVVLLGVTQSRSNPPPWHYVAPTLPTVGSLLFSDNEEVLVSILSALSLLLPGIQDANLCKRIFELLVSSTVRVQAAALGVLLDLAKFDSLQIETFLQADLLQLLKLRLQEGDPALRLPVLAVLNVLAAFGVHSKLFINSQILDLSLSLLSTRDHDYRLEVIRLIKHIAQGAKNCIASVIASGAVKMLCSTFGFFDKDDSTVYYCEVVNEVLSCLNSILDAVEVDEAVCNLLFNKYSTELGTDCIHQIGSLLKTVKEKLLDSSMDDSQFEACKILETTELRSKRFLARIFRAHQIKLCGNNCNLVTATMQPIKMDSTDQFCTVMKNINDWWELLYHSKQQERQLYLNFDENTKPPEQILKLLQSKYGVSLLQFCADEEEDSKRSEADFYKKLSEEGEERMHALHNTLSPNINLIAPVPDILTSIKAIRLEDELYF